MITLIEIKLSEDKENTKTNIILPEIVSLVNDMVSRLCTMTEEATETTQISSDASLLDNDGENKNEHNTSIALTGL